MNWFGIQLWRRKSVLGVIAASSSLLIAYLYYRKVSEDARKVLQKVALERADFIASLKVSKWTRPPVWTMTDPGNAWDSYRQAIQGLRGSLSIDHISYDKAFRLPQWDDLSNDEFDRFYRASSHYIRELSRGLSRSIVYPNRDYGLEFKSIRNEQLTIQLIAQFLLFAAKRIGRKEYYPESFKHIIIAMGIADDASRGSDSGSFEDALLVERNACQEIRSMLAERTYTASELELLATSLDRLDGARPEARDSIEITLMLDPQFNPLFFFTHPTVRQFWSKEILAAECSKNICTIRRNLDSVKGIPSHLKPKVMEDRAEESRLHGDMFSREAWSTISRILRRSNIAGMYRDLARIAVAIAWCQSETGHFPETLDRLVPKYVSCIPNCPYSGSPFRYKNGRVWSIGFDGKDDDGVAIEIAKELSVWYANVPTTGDVVFTIMGK